MAAIFIALTGTAFAASDLGKGDVTSKIIANGQVKTKDLANGAVTNPKIAANAVDAGKVVDNSLGGSEINESQLGQVPSAASADSATTAGSAPPTGSAGGGLAGNYPNPTIAANAIGSSQVAEDSLTGDDINDQTIQPQDCSVGFVTNVLEVSSDPDSTFGTTGISALYTCRDMGATIRRNGAGNYCIQFGGFSTSDYAGFPVMVSVNTSGANPADFAKVTTGDGGACPPDSYEVQSYLAAPFGVADANFTLITL